MEEKRPISKGRKAKAKANPFKTSGIKKYKDYDLEGAIEDFSRGLDINQNDVALHFNILSKRIRCRSTESRGGSQTD